MIMSEPQNEISEPQNEMSKPQNEMSKPQNEISKAQNEIYIGKKPLMTYVTACIVQLATEPFIIIKARGMSITHAVDVSQIILKRMATVGYTLGDVKISSELLESQDGRPRNVSTIDIEVKKA